MTTIHKLAFYMLGDQMAAEDITQSVFLKTWTHMPKWQTGQARLLTWMRRVATNACLDVLKKKVPIYTDDVPDVNDDADTPFEALARAQQSEYVQRALRILPDNQRAAIALSYYQGVSQKEGAAILNLSEGAYESLLVRARKSLKAQFAQNTPMRTVN